jgi:hypothetical protein
MIAGKSIYGFNIRSNTPENSRMNTPENSRMNTPENSRMNTPENSRMNTPEKNDINQTIYTQKYTQPLFESTFDIRNISNITYTPYPSDSSSNNNYDNDYDCDYDNYTYPPFESDGYLSCIEKIPNFNNSKYNEQVDKDAKLAFDKNKMLFNRLSLNDCSFDTINDILLNMNKIKEYAYRHC